MRLDDESESTNFEDRTGRRSGGFGFPMGGGGGGLRLGGGQMGCGGLVLVVIIALVLGINPLTLLGDGQLTAPAPQIGQQGGGQTGQSTIDPQTRSTILRVLGSTERRWTELFAARGQRYQPPTLVFYSRNDRSGCGAAQSAMGPFYCPADQGVYLDVTFFDELASKFGAGGDFAPAYVIAHEVGHHVQNLTGIADQVRQAQSRASEAQGNALQVRMELQADCYAGVWAANDRNLLEAGDVEEGMTAANAIGDDTLQKKAQGYVVPESFTHGSSAQRMQWLKRGLESGDPAQCDTFADAR